MKAVLQTALASCGYELRKHRNVTDQLGRHAFRDMRRLTQSGDAPTIFDIGGHYGQTTQEFRKWFSNPTVHTFEPDRASFDKLMGAVGSLPNVYPNNVALGAYSGTATFVENTSPDMGSFLEPGVDCWGAIKARTTLPLTTVDAYAEGRKIDRIDILKTDTQGYDLEVMKGAARTFAANRVHMVYMEIIFSEMYAGLPRLDEVCRFMFDNRFKLVTFYDIFYQNDRASWTDALFINPAFTR